eukprot:6202297-Pleurochrysis_carterae.AAC.1
MPGDLWAPQPTEPTGKRWRARARKPLPSNGRGARPGGRAGRERRASARRAHRDCGPLATGVYADKVLRWFVFHTADAAVSALRARASGTDVPVPHVPTVVISQLEMPTWARGVVWDCAEPADCRPVQRSARDSRFRGERQLNREALRAAAATLGWPDRDIVNQVGEGGVEV